MVGLGDSEEKSAEKHEAKTDALATDNPIDAAPAADENVEDKLLKSADHAAPHKVH
jgi:hypothetical protein